MLGLCQMLQIVAYEGLQLLLPCITVWGESLMDRIPGTVSTVCQLLAWQVKREKWRDHFKTLWAILFNSGLFWKKQSRGPKNVHGSQSSGNIAQGTEKRGTYREHRPVPEASHPHRGVIRCFSTGSWISQVLQGPALKRCILRPHPSGKASSCQPLLIFLLQAHYTNSSTKYRFMLCKPLRRRTRVRVMFWVIDVTGFCHGSKLITKWQFSSAKGISRLTLIDMSRATCPDVQGAWRTQSWSLTWQKLPRVEPSPERAHRRELFFSGTDCQEWNP